MEGIEKVLEMLERQMDSLSSKLDKIDAKLDGYVTKGEISWIKVCMIILFGMILCLHGFEGVATILAKI